MSEKSGNNFVDDIDLEIQKLEEKKKKMEIKKPPPKIEKKEVEQIQEVEPEKKEPNVNDLIDTLKIPTESAKGSEPQKTIVEELTDSGMDDDMMDSLNDKLDGDEDDDFQGHIRTGEIDDDELFDDYGLIAEMGVEVIDTIACLGCQYLAGESNEEKYSVSDYKKSKIKKPLIKLLRKRQTKITPELAFIVIVLIVYTPMFLKAYNERKKKKEVEEQKEREETQSKLKSLESITPPPPPVVLDGDGYVPEERKKAMDVIITPPPKPKKRGRPKGSKDAFKRDNKNYQKKKK